MKKKNLIISIVTLLLFLLSVGLSNLPNQAQNAAVYDVDYKDKTTLNTNSGVTALYFGITRGPSGIDPQINWGSDSLAVIDQVVEGLFAYNLSDPKMGILPNLASDYGIWSGNNYTINLRPNIYFHDGTLFDAYAVKFTFDRLNYFIENSFTQGMDLYNYFDVQVGQIRSIINRTEIINNSTIKFVLNQRVGIFETLLCFEGSYIVSPSSTPATEMIEISTGTLVGTGPFVYDNYEDNIEVNFHAFENYWKGAPNITNLKFVIIDDYQARENALLSGYIDMIIDPLDSMLDIYRADPNITLEFTQGFEINYLGMNDYWINASFRKAISYAIDYSYIIDVLMDSEAVRMKSPFPENMMYANWSYNVADFNITKARGIMQSMGFGVGFTTDAQWQSATFASFKYSYNVGNSFKEDLMVLLWNCLDLIGIGVIDDGITWAEYLNRLLGGDEAEKNLMQLYWFSWTPDYNDPHSLADLLFTNSSTVVSNLAFHDFMVQSWVEEALIETNYTLRNNLYNKIQKQLVEELYPWAFGYVPLEYVAYRNDISGFQWNPMKKVSFFGVNGIYRIIPTPSPTYNIDGSSTGIGAQNWTWAVTQDWCSGSGTLEDPYVIKDLIIDAPNAGIIIKNSEVYFKIVNCTIINSVNYEDTGIQLSNVENGKIIGNNCSNNQWYGISLSNSANCTILNNFLINNYYGITALTCQYLNISNNYMSNVEVGIAFDANCFNSFMDNNTVIEANIGISPGGQNHVFKNNLLEKCGFIFYYYNNLYDLTTYSIDTSNTVNGKPIIYYSNRDNLVPADFFNSGQVMLVNCNNSLISNLTLSQSTAGIMIYGGNYNNLSNLNLYDHSWSGIFIQESSHNTIESSTISNQYNGVYIIDGSTFNIIENNNISNNMNGITLGNNSNIVRNNIISNNLQMGLYTLWQTTGNLIYNNSFIGNSVNAGEDGVNFWDNGLIGNYWDNYNGVDANDDGIGDSPYRVAGGLGGWDNYPIWDDGLTVDNVDPSIVINKYDECALFGTGAIFIEAFITDNIQLELPITIEFYYPNGTLINGYDMILNITDSNDTFFYYWLVDSLPVLDDYYFIISANDSSNNSAQSSEFFDIVLEAPTLDYWILSPFSIDENGYGDFTWAQAVNEEWCSGSGTLNDPYVLKNIIINGQGSDYCLSIGFSEEYFIVENCTFYNTYNLNFYGGIVLINSSNGKLFNNNCSNNYFAGIQLFSSHNFLISGNLISASSYYGIHIAYGSSNNTIYNNTFINNHINAFDDGNLNFWDNGTIGNYWDDYSGVDANDDGIGDSPYVIEGIAGSTDNYPIWDDGPTVDDVEPSILIGYYDDYAYFGTGAIFIEAYITDNFQLELPITIEFYYPNGTLINVYDMILNISDSSDTYFYYWTVDSLPVLDGYYFIINAYDTSNNLGVASESFDIVIEPPTPDTGWIEVNVKDNSTSSPISSVYVQIVNMSSGIVIQTGYTNGAGFYNATGLLIGWHEVIVSKAGYQDMIKQNYINWNGDDDYLSFYLNEIIPDYWILSPFVIDDYGNGDYTWAEAAMEDWCSGSGTWSDPYIIENVTINGLNSGSCIEIINSNKFFIIRNCVLFNSAMGTHPNYHGGIRLIDVSNGAVFNNNCSSNNGVGVYLKNCLNITISHNLISKNLDGIFQFNTENCTTKENWVIDQSIMGIWINNGNNNLVINNTILQNNDGISISDGESNSISHNYIADNVYYDIKLLESYNTILFNNSMVGSGLYLRGSFEEISTHIINQSNLVNGKPLYYYINLSNLVNDNFTNAGQIILINCSDSFIANLKITKTGRAISLFYCERISIRNCNITDNKYHGFSIRESSNNEICENSVEDGQFGIYITYSNNNNISHNSITNIEYEGIFLSNSNNNSLRSNYLQGNKCNIYLGTSSNNILTNNKILNGIKFGIRLSNSVNNIIYLNTFAGNLFNGYDDGDNTKWDNGIIGNYWDDYIGVDINDDGIGDSPYYIPGSAGSRDNFPIWDDGIDDYLPPITTISIGGVQGQDDWYTSTVNLTLTAMDDASGVAYTEYSYDGYVWFTYDDVIRLNEDGSLIFYYRSVDYTGKIEQYSNISLKIDRTNPATTISLSGSLGNADWYNSDVTISFNVYETISGLNFTEYSFDEMNWITYTTNIYIDIEGNTTIYYRAIDNAGNIEGTNQEIIFIDKSSPVSTIDVEGTMGNDNWYLSSILVNISAIDHISGVDLIQYSYDETNWLSFYQPILLSDEGLNSIHIRAVDKAGNVELYQTFSYLIDTIDPSTTIILDGIDGLDDWFTSNVTISFEIIETGSGLSYTEYSLDGVTWNLFTTPFNISDEGNTTIFYISLDNAGNNGTILKEIFKIDYTQPLTSVNIEGLLVFEDWYDSNASITLLAEDILSGVSTTQYSFNSINWLNYTEPFNMPRMGELTLYYRSTDLAGNIETTKSITIKTIGFPIIIESFIRDLYDRLAEIQELISSPIPDQALVDLEQAEHMLLLAIDLANKSLLESSFSKLTEVVNNLLDAETYGISTSSIIDSLMSNIDDVTYLKIVEAESLLLGESNRHLDKAWVYYNKAQGLWNNGKLQSAINYFAKAIGKVKDALR